MEAILIRLHIVAFLGWVTCESDPQIRHAECIQDGIGAQYMGTEMTTRSGLMCQSWSSTHPNDHPYHNQPGSFPDPTVEEASNYCRNPDGDDDGPWCFSLDAAMRWESCGIPPCGAEDCVMDSRGLEYSGAISVTGQGLPCQPWASQTPHAQPFSDTRHHPDTEATTLGSACRNPDNDTAGPWCYTTDPEVRWQYCDLPLCEPVLSMPGGQHNSGGKPEETVTPTREPPRSTVDPYTAEQQRHAYEEPRVTCKLTKKGLEYVGYLAETRDGYRCQRWAEQSPHPHNQVNETFPEQSLELAENHCRNPDAEPEGPWCYTTDPAMRWQYCDVQLCGTAKLWAQLTVVNNPEHVCLSTMTGGDYRGFVAMTAHGERCLNWTEEMNIRHPDSGLERNYCRNPGGQRNTIGCFAHGRDNVVTWRTCDVPLCRTSMSCRPTVRGEDYTGTVSVTGFGRPCEDWLPLASRAGLESRDFTDLDLQWMRNYCRNPRGMGERPWCFTSQRLEWEYCDIPQCQDCYIDIRGTGWAGKVNKTKSGKSCQNWMSILKAMDEFVQVVVYSIFNLPEKDVQLAENFCRNPDGSAIGPWCYLDINATQRESCAINACAPPAPNLRGHVVHIMVEGLHPCFVEAQPENILKRIKNEGSYTLENARSLFPPEDLPCLAGMLTSLTPEESGVTENSWDSGILATKNRIKSVMGNKLPTVFFAIKSQDPSVQTAMIGHDKGLSEFGNKAHDKSTVNMEALCRADMSDGHCDYTLTDPTCEYLDATLRTFSKSYTFLQLTRVQDVGRQNGWCSHKYLRAVQDMDIRIGKILDVIDEFHSDVSVVLSTDHGVQNASLGGFSEASLMIPLLLRGPGIKVNYTLQGAASILDIAPTVLHMLGLKPSPWWRGKLLEEIFKDKSSETEEDDSK